MIRHIPPKIAVVDNHSFVFLDISWVKEQNPIIVNGFIADAISKAKTGIGLNLDKIEEMIDILFYLFYLMSLNIGYLIKNRPFILFSYYVLTKVFDVIKNWYINRFEHFQTSLVDEKLKSAGLGIEFIDAVNEVIYKYPRRRNYLDTFVVYDLILRKRRFSEL